MLFGLMTTVAVLTLQIIFLVNAAQPAVAVACDVNMTDAAPVARAAATAQKPRAGEQDQKYYKNMSTYLEELLGRVNRRETTADALMKDEGVLELFGCEAFHSSLQEALAGGPLPNSIAELVLQHDAFRQHLKKYGPKLDFDPPIFRVFCWPDRTERVRRFDTLLSEYLEAGHNPNVLNKHGQSLFAVALEKNRYELAVLEGMSCLSGEEDFDEK